MILTLITVGKMLEARSKGKTTDALNVRSAPSTDAATKIGLLTLGTEVEFVSDYDDTWCVIKYNGQDAYVSKEFLTPVQ